MQFIADHLLTLILFAPLAGAVAVMLTPGDQKRAVRWVALLGSLVPLGLAITLWFSYNATGGGFQFEEQATWYAAINASYHLGVDGISVPMILLTTLLVPLGILTSFGIEDRVKVFMALFLMLESGMLGVFMALDLILFFLFWEIGLVPMYFMISLWGSEKGERDVAGRKVPARTYASFKFMVYTMAGSLGLLLAIQLIGLTAGTFDMVELFKVWPAFNVRVFEGVSIGTVKTIAFWAFVIAFLIKVPVWPFHTWLPDAHTEAPTAGSMILAGVLLKLGAYGLLRLVLPLFPEQAQAAAPFIAFLAMLAIVLGALAAYGQTDFKRLVAYSSINHMGFVVLGIAVAAWAYGARSDGAQLSATIAASGAVLQMFNHGLSAAAMFFLVGVVYERAHTRDLNELGGGIWQLAPVYGGILIFSSLASLGLPGLNGFVSEFAIVRGSWPVFTVITAISMFGLLFTGAYILKGIQKVLHGPRNEQWAGHGMEINTREVVVVAPLMALMLLIGVWPWWIMNVINETIKRLVA
ncbi:MAG: NuoM family protein [Anaerolineales bacterium]